ncbi:MAG: Rieske 2Fe-2S domain-containing protein, partial [Actinobacteria bacterium]|nr:Rieske 2Fe-2S domain-containing protein [Actinomycetota bacterium]
FHAVGDECTHEYASLSEGELQENVVECPLHSSQFDVTTGEVQFPPADEDLPVYAVRVEGDDILVGPRQN